jgi:hypothetical protein
VAQHDFDIANQSAPDFRADLNDALEALATLSSGGTAPSTTYANMLWYDTANNILKMRTEADDAWINVAYVDQSDNAWRVLDDTQVVNTSGAQTGLLGDQSTATWEAGTGTTESLVSPAKVKAAIAELSPTPFIPFEHISTVVLAGDSTVAFTLDNTTYESYFFTFSNVRPGSDNNEFTVRTSSDGGSSYDSGGSDYVGHVGGGSFIKLTGSIGRANNDEDGFSGQVWLLSPGLSNRKTIFVGETFGFNSGGDADSWRANGARQSLSATDAVQFRFSSGNLQKGTISFYGVRKPE